MSISVRIIVQNFEAPFGAFLLVGPMTDFCSQSLIYIVSAAREDPQQG